MSFRDDLRVTLRSLRNRPAMTAAAVLTLAVGIGANTAVFSYVQALLLRPLPFSRPEQLVQVETVRSGAAGKLASLEVQDLSRETQLLSGVASFRLTQYTITSDGPPEAVVAAMSTYNLFALLGAPPFSVPPGPRRTMGGSSSGSC